MHLLIALTYMRHRSLCYLEPKRTMDEWKSPDRSSPCFCDKLSTPSMVATWSLFMLGTGNVTSVLLSCTLYLKKVLTLSPYSHTVLCLHSCTCTLQSCSVIQGRDLQATLNGLSSLLYCVFNKNH